MEKVISKFEDFPPTSEVGWFSLDLHLFLKCNSSAGLFTYFANQQPGSFIDGTFRLRLVKNQNYFWKYCIALNKCLGLNTLTRMPNA